MIPLSIIIVNYKSGDLVLNCLRTIYAETEPEMIEIFVVDNFSGADEKKKILGAFPSVQWIPMSYNAGFARANNEGIRRSRGKAVLLLNADTLIENRAIEKCYTELAASAFTAAGIQLLNADRTPQISGLYAVRGGVNYLLPLPFLGRFLGNLAKWIGVPKPHIASGFDVKEVDWINGAFLMVKMEAIEKAGLMDEDFFLYAEEAEWCSRLQKTGRLCVFGFISAVHLEGETVNRETGSGSKGIHHLHDRKGLQIMLSNFVRIRKQYGAGWFLFILSFYLLEIPVYFFGVLIVLLVRGKKSTERFSDFRNYCKNIFVILGKSGIILKNKPYFYKVL